MELTAYHGTISKHERSIKEKGLDPEATFHRKDHWLGQGVYFFDDKEKALWWAKSLLRRNPACRALVYCAQIAATDEDVLDLTDKVQVDKFYKESRDFAKQNWSNGKEEYPVFSQDEFRAVFFDYYKMVHNISVIIAMFSKEYAGYTARIPPEEIGLHKRLVDLTQIFYHEKQICVSKKDVIRHIAKEEF